MKLSKFIFYLSFISYFLISCTNEIDIVDVAEFNEEKILLGQELAQGVASCGFCHGIAPSPTSPMAGGREFKDLYGSIYASNITPSKTGIGSYTLTDFISAIRESKALDGRPISKDFHYGLRWASDHDLSAIFSYLMTQQPVKNEITKREIDFWQRNTLGLLESSQEVKGYVPQMRNKDQIKIGAYVVDHLADCGRCHNSKAGFLSSSLYLGGGQNIYIDGNEIVAPSLVLARDNGLKDWSKKQILDYLLTGKTKNGNLVNPSFCPVEFYQNARIETLEAISAYLESINQ